MNNFDLSTCFRISGAGAGGLDAQDLGWLRNTVGRPSYKGDIKELVAAERAYVKDYK